MNWKSISLLSALMLGGIAIFYLVTPAPDQARQAPDRIAELPELSGPVLMTVAGLDPSKVASGEVSLDLGRLKFLGEAEFETSTIWTEGVHRYTGVMLDDLLSDLGVTGRHQKLLLSALNDYSVEIPLTEVEPDAPMVAYLSDGEPMSIRDKGPLWLIYPFDLDKKYRTDTVSARSIWQLDRIEVME